MHLRSTLSLRTGRRRVGFTLIELLAVIAIIAILVALSAAAVLKYMGTQQITVSQQKVNTVASQLNKAWSTVSQHAMNNVDSSKYPTVVTTWGGGDSARTKVIYVKCALKQAFPTSFAEALNPYPMPPLPAYTAYLGKLGITTATASAPPANYESAACLLMALQRGPSGMSLTQEDLGVSSTADFPAGNGTIKAIVDSWGQPVIFCRWPTGSTFLNPSGAQPGFNDPGDRQGLLTNAVWLSTSAGPFQTYIHKLPARAAGAPATSYRLIPLVASAGPDQKPGVNYLTTYPYDLSPDGSGADSDDIYSQN